MKRITKLVLSSVAILAAGSLSACGGSNNEYIMGLKDGRLIVTTGKPELDPVSGVYNYRGKDGIRTTINKDEVVQILER